MKIVFRLVAALLLGCLLLPQSSRAGGDYGVAPYEIGEKLFARKEFKTALKYYRKALGRNDLRAAQRIQEIEERQKKEEADRFTDLLQRARSLLAQRKYREAEKFLLKAAAKDKSRPEIHFLLGEAYLGLEAYGKAKAEYTKAKGAY